MTAEELREVDRRVNDWILENHTVTTQIMPYREALATGAMALFSEKYGDQVRVVTMGSSKELCGGTHVAATGQIGLYLTRQEASIGTSVRRIEALTGTGAERYLRSRSDIVAMMAERLQTTPDQSRGPGATATRRVELHSPPAAPGSRRVGPGRGEPAGGFRTERRRECRWSRQW